MNEEQKDLLRSARALSDLGGSPGDQAIVALMTILITQVSQQNESLERIAMVTEQLAKQFNQISAGGTSLLTEQA